MKDPVAAEKLGKQFLYTKLARCAPGRRGGRARSSARRAGGWPKRAALALPGARTTLTAACPGPRCSIPSRYAHAQSEVEAAKQVWARRSELQLSEVRAAAAWGVAPARAVHCSML